MLNRKIPLGTIMSPIDIGNAVRNPGHTYLLKFFRQALLQMTDTAGWLIFSFWGMLILPISIVELRVENTV